MSFTSSSSNDFTDTETSTSDASTDTEDDIIVHKRKNKNSDYVYMITQDRLYIRGSAADTIIETPSSVILDDGTFEISCFDLDSIKSFNYTKYKDMTRFIGHNSTITIDTMTDDYFIIAPFFKIKEYTITTTDPSTEYFDFTNCELYIKVHTSLEYSDYGRDGVNLWETFQRNYEYISQNVRYTPIVEKM